MCEITLTRIVRGRDSHVNIIPTVCNIQNMLGNLLAANGNQSQLLPWQMRSFLGYDIESIKSRLLVCPNENDRIKIIKQHILNNFPINFGRHFVDVYLVAYVAENGMLGRKAFCEYLSHNGIENAGSRRAICQVGFGDGLYLQILNSDGTIRDCDFFKKLLHVKVKSAE